VLPIDDFFWEAHRLYWAFFLGSFVNFLFSFEQFFLLFFLVFCVKFRHESFASMWNHYGSWVVGVYSKPFSRALGPTINLLWWYKLIVHGKLCLICYSFKELGFGGFISMLQVLYL
jgi:hypothetical protein